MKRYPQTDLKHLAAALCFDCSYNTTSLRSVYWDRRELEIVCIPLGGTDERKVEAALDRYSHVGTYTAKITPQDLYDDLQNLKAELNCDRIPSQLGRYAPVIRGSYD